MSTSATPKLELLPRDAKCACVRSVSYDPTGENAVECNAPAVVECEHCGPMCAECHEETFCIFSEHKIIAVADLIGTTDEFDQAVGA